MRLICADEVEICLYCSPLPRCHWAEPMVYVRVFMALVTAATILPICVFKQRIVVQRGGVPARLRTGDGFNCGNDWRFHVHLVGLVFSVWRKPTIHGYSNWLLRVLRREPVVHMDSRGLTEGPLPVQHTPELRDIVLSAVTPTGFIQIHCPGERGGVLASNVHSP